MRKSLIAFVAIAAMVVLGTSAAKASVTEIFLASDGFSSGVISGTGMPSVASTSGSLNGWTYAVVGTSNSPSSQPLFGLQSFTIEAYCVSGGCTTEPLDVLVSDVGFASVPGLWTTLDVTAEPSAGGTTQVSAFNPLNGYFTGVPFGVLSVSGSASNSQPLTGAAYFPISITGPFSETLADIFSSGGATGTMNAFEAMGEIGATPEPRTLLLFGTGLFLIGAFIRRQLHA